MNTTLKKLKILLSFSCTVIGLIVLFFYSLSTGSIKLNILKLFQGLFVTYDSNVFVIYDLRFPRIIISMLAGACLASAGALFQAVLKNPLADPGILGISSGAGFTASIATAFLPQLYYITPIFSFLGGLFVFAFVYFLSWNGSLSPLRIILMGVAMQSLFSGLSSVVKSISGGNLSGAASIVEGNISMKTWQDVQILFFVSCIGLLLVLLCSKGCDICSLEDKTARSLGINIDLIRFLISLVAVFLACGCTSIVGVVSFVGLLVPHIGRILVGSNHKLLLPFSMLLGAFLFLLADTLGRTIAYPYEINASVLLSVIGGITFIILLKRNGDLYGK